MASRIKVATTFCSALNLMALSIIMSVTGIVTSLLKTIPFDHTLLFGHSAKVENFSQIQHIALTFFVAIH